VGKDDAFTWLMEKLFDEAVSHFAPTWVLTGLMIVGAVVWLIKAHAPESERERVEASTYDFFGRLFISLLLGVVGGLCGGIGWSVLARNLALVDRLGGPTGPGIAAITAAVITALVAFVTYGRWSRPSSS
jgi:hypothetical protein